MRHFKGLICAALLTACAAQGYHPDSNFVRGFVPYHQKVVRVDDITALVATTWISNTENVGRVHTVEVISRYGSHPIPSNDAALARSFATKACRGIKETDVENASLVSRPGGYYRFEGLACRLAL